MLDWLRRALVRARPLQGERFERRVSVEERTPPPERFVLSVALMIVFFVGLVALEIAYMFFMGEWNDVVFNGVMLVVGSLIGALFGYREAP